MVIKTVPENCRMLRNECLAFFLKVVEETLSGLITSSVALIFLQEMNHIFHANLISTQTLSQVLGGHKD